MYIPQQVLMRKNVLFRINVTTYSRTKKAKSSSRLNSGRVFSSFYFRCFRVGKKSESHIWCIEKVESFRDAGTINLTMTSLVNEPLNIRWMDKSCTLITVTVTAFFTCNPKKVRFIPSWTIVDTSRHKLVAHLSWRQLFWLFLWYSLGSHWLPMDTISVSLCGHNSRLKKFHWRESERRKKNYQKLVQSTVRRRQMVTSDWWWNDFNCQLEWLCSLVFCGFWLSNVTTKVCPHWKVTLEFPCPYFSFPSLSLFLCNFFLVV